MEDNVTNYWDQRFQYSSSFDSLTIICSKPGLVYSYLLSTSKKNTSHGQQTSYSLTGTIPSQQHRHIEKISASNQNAVEVSFKQLITLACQNKSNFYALFQERYPLLHQRLLATVSDLRLSELTLCAYIYLDFSAKDISRYTFKSIRTIQARKSQLRKRLSIPSSEDIYIWMKNLNSPDFKNP
jgi:hypothetical protein